MRVLQVMASNTDIHAAQHDCRSFLDQYKGCRGGHLPSHPLISCLKLLMLVRCLSICSSLHAEWLPGFLRLVSAYRGSVCIALASDASWMSHACTTPLPSAMPSPCCHTHVQSDRRLAPQAQQAGDKNQLSCIMRTSILMQI